MQYKTIEFKVSVPKLNYFFLSMLTIGLMIGLPIINFIHWFLTDTIWMFDLMIGWIIIAISLFMIFSRYMETTSFQYDSMEKNEQVPVSEKNELVPVSEKNELSISDILNNIRLDEINNTNVSINH